MSIPSLNFNSLCLTDNHAEMMKWLSAANSCELITTKRIIERVNVWWNVNIDYTKDGPDRDSWQTPGETLERGEGDCEDIAIGKYFDLKALGLEPVLVYAIMKAGGGHLYCSYEGMALDCQDALWNEICTFNNKIIYVRNIESHLHPFKVFPQWKRIVEKMELK